MKSKETAYKIKISGGPIIVPEKEISAEIAHKVISLIMEGMPKSKGSEPDKDTQDITNDSSQTKDDGFTPKLFMARKKPSTESERITCLAYYLSKYRNLSAFKTKDLTKLNTEAAQNTFSNPTAFARNAEMTGYLAKAGGGSKQISSLGEALVEALPDREKVKELLSESKKKYKKHTPKKSRKINRK